jgi:hypothetical protein
MNISLQLVSVKHAWSKTSFHVSCNHRLTHLDQLGRRPPQRLWRFRRSRLLEAQLDVVHAKVAQLGHAITVDQHTR